MPPSGPSPRKSPGPVRRAGPRSPRVGPPGAGALWPPVRQSGAGLSGSGGADRCACPGLGGPYRRLGGPLAADAPPWAAPLFGFELVLDPLAPPAAAIRAPAFDPVVRTGARAVAAGGHHGARKSRSCSDGWAASCSSGSPSRATTGAPSCRRACEASRSGSRSGPPDRTLRDAEIDADRRRGSSPRWRMSWASSGAAPTRPRRRVTVAYTYDRPDQKAAGRPGAAAPAPSRGAGRLAAADAEGGGRAAGGRANGGVLAGPELKEARQRVIELETENQALRQRIEAAQERLKALAARLSFLEQHGGGNAA